MSVSLAALGWWMKNVGTTSMWKLLLLLLHRFSKKKIAFELQKKKKEKKNLGVLLFWFVENKRDGYYKRPGLFSTMLCTLETRGPGVSHTSLVPTMAALFLDENLPDGTRLEPGTKFIKYWKMRNSGTISWTSETKVPLPPSERTGSTLSLPPSSASLPLWAPHSAHCRLLYPLTQAKISHPA